MPVFLYLSSSFGLHAGSVGFPLVLSGSCSFPLIPSGGPQNLDFSKILIWTYFLYNLKENRRFMDFAIFARTCVYFWAHVISHKDLRGFSHRPDRRIYKKNTFCLGPPTAGEHLKVPGARETIQ